MAVEGEAPEKMLRVHRSGYDSFVWIMKWGAVISFIVAMLVMYLIA